MCTPDRMNLQHANESTVTCNLQPTFNSLLDNEMSVSVLLMVVSIRPDCKAWSTSRTPSSTVRRAEKFNTMDLFKRHGDISHGYAAIGHILVD